MAKARADISNLLIAFFCTVFLMACTSSVNTTHVAITASIETPQPSLSASPTLVIPTPIFFKSQTPSPAALVMSPTSINTTRPSITPTPLPDYSNLPPLAQLVVTKHDACFAQYQLPVINEYRDVREIDLTSSLDPKYCMIDCIRRRWLANDGANLTVTIARVASPSDAKALLKEELDRVQQLYSDREKYLGVGFDDPYEGEGDNSWAGKPYPGLTGYHAVVSSSVLIIMEWTQVPQGYDLEFDFGMTEKFARLQFQKIDSALGTPFPSLTQQARCSP